VTFMFDDGYKSTKDVAKPILDQYGFPGSAAAISSVVATNEEMTAQDLRDLQAAGWDIASHSVTHPSFPTLSISAARTELLNSKNRLTGWGLTIDSFVWPYGDYNQAVIGLPKPAYPVPRCISPPGTLSLMITHMGRSRMRSKFLSW
jgi:peptidoglycan/xylan/chitin deacetylase (PgdA/CDA1 family)